MPKEPEEFEESKDRFKMTLLQMEKRFVDLEMAVDELNGKVENIDLKSVSELKQKVDDIEDLIMVEQAGVLELKKMLEGLNEKLGQSPAMESANEKMAVIEKYVNELKGNVVMKNELQDMAGRLENSISAVSVKSPPTSVEVENLIKRFNDLNGQMNSLSARMENNIKILFEKIKESETKEPMIKSGIDFDLLSSKIESLKISLDGMVKKKIEMDLKIVEMEKKFEIIENRIRESISEKIMDEIKGNKRDLMTANIRVDSLERVSRELISTVQNLENSMKKFENIDKMTSFGKDIEEKIERFKFVEEEMKRLSARTEMIYDNIDKKLEKIKFVERKTDEIFSSLQRLRRDTDATRILVLDRAKKEDLKNLYKMMDEIKGKTNVGELNKFMASMEERMALIERNYKKDIEVFISTVQARMSEVGKTTPVFDTQMSELLNKLIFLETRMMTLEKIMQEPSKTQPVILE